MTSRQLRASRDRSDDGFPFDHPHRYDDRQNRLDGQGGNEQDEAEFVDERATLAIAVTEEAMIVIATSGRKSLTMAARQVPSEERRPAWSGTSAFATAAARRYEARIATAKGNICSFVNVASSGNNVS